jgi:O-antigen ligase
MGAFGYSMKKIIFPIYPKSHPNMVGALGGYLFILASGYYLHIKNKSFRIKGILVAYLVISLIIILMGDSRGTLFGSLLTVMLMLMLVGLKKVQLLKYSVIALPFSNILFIVMLQLTAHTSFMEQISRNGSHDLATGNSRKFIYAAANNELADFKPIHLVGYGEYGIYGAGLIKYYMKKFGYETESQRLISSVAHNTVLQVIFDTGYLGLIAFLMLLYFVFSQAYTLSRKADPVFLLVLYFLTYYVLTGISETTFGNYFTFLNLMFLLFVFTTINTYNISLTLKPYSPEILSNTQETIQLSYR